MQSVNVRSHVISWTVGLRAVQVSCDLSINTAVPGRSKFNRIMKLKELMGPSSGKYLREGFIGKKYISKKWKNMVQLWLPREGEPPKLGYSEATRRPSVTLKDLESHSSDGKAVHRPTIAWTHPTKLHEMVARRKPLLIKCHMNSHLEFAKRHVESSLMVQLDQNRIL